MDPSLVTTLSVSVPATASILATSTVSIQGTIGTQVIAVADAAQAIQWPEILIGVGALAAAFWAALGTWNSHRSAALGSVVSALTTRNYYVRFWEANRALGYSKPEGVDRFSVPQIETIDMGAIFNRDMPVYYQILSAPSTVVGGKRVLGELEKTRISRTSASVIGALFGPAYTDEPVADLVTFYHVMLQVSGWIGMGHRLASFWRQRLGSHPFWVKGRARAVLQAAGVSVVHSAVAHRFLASHLLTVEEPAKGARVYREAYGVRDPIYADLADLMISTAERSKWLAGSALEELRWRERWTLAELEREMDAPASIPLGEEAPDQ